jgi:hypothetical protein
MSDQSYIPDLGLTIEQRRVLQVLAETSDGFTPSALNDRGISPTVVIELVAAGYAVAASQSVRVGSRISRVTRFVITRLGGTRSGENMMTRPLLPQRSDRADGPGEHTAERRALAYMS